MNIEDKREDFGYDENLFKNFLKDNPDIPKGTFQRKKRAASYYWYYTLSAKLDSRVKYISKAEIIKEGKNSSFMLALDLLKGKLEESSRLKSNQPDGPLKDMWTSHKFSMNLVNPANKTFYGSDKMVVSNGRFSSGFIIPSITSTAVTPKRIQNTFHIHQ